MNINSKLYALSVLALSLTQPTAVLATPLKSTKVMKDFVRQCEYMDGVILRILMPRECPVLETSAPTPPAPTVIKEASPQSVGVGDQKTEQPIKASLPAAKASDDIILERSISRCTSIGYKRETAEFRSCVTEQISLLSK